MPQCEQRMLVEIKFHLFIVCEVISDTHSISLFVMEADIHMASVCAVKIKRVKQSLLRTSDCCCICKFLCSLWLCGLLSDATRRYSDRCKLTAQVLFSYLSFRIWTDLQKQMNFLMLF